MESEYKSYLNKAHFEDYLAELKQIINNKTVLIYGAGIFFEYIYKNYSLQDFNIIGISDKRFSDSEEGLFFMNYKIIPAALINKYHPDYILVATINNKKLIQILSHNLDNDITILPLVKEIEEKYDNNIMFEAVKTKMKNCGFDCTFNNKEAIFTNNSLNILTDIQYPWVVQEIFADKIYNLKTNIDKSKNYTVFDIGANRCYASLYFAQMDWVKNIYAFELVPQTSEFALKNIALNPNYKNKIKLYPFGLGKNNEDIIIDILPHRDGCNTIIKEFANIHMPEEKNNGVAQLCKVKQASALLKKLIEENNLDNIIFKIDVEGAEYDILEDLRDNYPEIFDKIFVLIGDAHLGFERFFNILPKNKFKVVYKHTEPDGCCPFEIVKNNLI